MKYNIKDLPTKFRGCFWDDGWEFDGPTVIYYPWKYRAYSDSYSNSGGIENLLECMIIDISLGNDLSGYQRSLDTEMLWRKWGKQFSRRKSATHLEISGEWCYNDYGDLDFKENASISWYYKNGKKLYLRR